MNRVVVLWTALACAGCLGDPTPATCADSPDLPGCSDVPDEGPRADEGLPPDGDAPDIDAPDEGPTPDGGEPPDEGPLLDEGVMPDGARPDEGPPPDADVDPDMAPEPDAMAGECMPGTSIPCGSAIGACQQGQSFCNAEGMYEACIGNIDPVDEACNGVDDDCDESTDEGCDCVDGSTQPCGSAEGVCRQGMQICVDGGWSDCNGEVIGRAETCDGLDEDCNGAVDDVPGVGDACSAGLGACRRDGTLSCLGSEDGFPTCNAPAVLPGAERCDAVDNDCDGRTDEALPANPNLLLPDQQVRLGADTDLAPAVARVGAEFHGVGWVDDGVLRYGIALGSEWEVEPQEIGFYNGDDSIAVAVAADRVGDDAVALAVGYDGLGSGVSVHIVGGNARQVGQRYGADTNGSTQVDIAHSGQAFGLVYVESDRLDQTDELIFEYVRDGEMVFRRVIGIDRRTISDPRVVWTGTTFAVAFVAGDPRTSTGGIYTAFIDPNAAGARIIPTQTVETGTGDTPDIAWLPDRRRLVMVWTEDAGGEGPRVHFGTVGGLGLLAERAQIIGGAGEARHPVLMPRVRGGEADTLGVAWLRGAASPRSVAMTWMIAQNGNWTASPTVAQLTQEVVDASGPTGAYVDDGEGYGIAITAEGAAELQGDGLMFLSGNVGCPQLP